MPQGLRRPSLRTVSPFLTLALVCALTGCRSGQHTPGWPGSSFVSSLCSCPSDEIPSLEHAYVCQPSADLALEISERYFGLAHVEQTHGDECCVDNFYHAALFAWRAIELQGGYGAICSSTQDCGSPASCSSSPCSNSCTGGGCTGTQKACGVFGCLQESRCCEVPRCVQLYNDSVGYCLQNACRFGRWNPTSGRLRICTQRGWRDIPFNLSGLAWQPQQIQKLTYMDRAWCKERRCSGCRAGLGATLLATYYKNDCDPHNKHFLDEHPFPLTAVLQPACDRSDNGFVFVDPLRTTHITTNVGVVPLASQNPAATTEYMRQAGVHQNAKLAYMLPDLALPYRNLYLLEPYQAGKIPVVFVHGFISDSTTWKTMIDRMQRDPEIMARYQIWLYFYPTSPPLIETAAAMREDLQNMVAEFDPAGSDPALQRMVLVGGSMGGLMCKLQVTHSGNRVWDGFSTRPFSQIQCRPETRRFFANMLYFEPLPFVERVVFVATPHKGAAFPTRLVACVGQSLAGHIDESEEYYEDLIRNNRGVIRNASRFGIPTSVRSLIAYNPILMAVDELPYGSRVKRHSQIGVLPCLIPGEPHDGIITVRSARTPGVESELMAKSFHDHVNKKPAVLEDLIRILYVHLDEEPQP